MSASITWCGHSTFRLTLADGRVIAIDPWLTENPACPDSLKKWSRCDLILVSHGHSDHVGDVKKLVEAFNPPVVANYDLCSAFGKVMGNADYRGMNTGGSQTIDGVRVSMTKAFHSSALETPDGPMYAGMPNGLIIETDGLASIYHTGDTDVFGDMQIIRQLWSPKICMLPIGDWFTMGAKGAALAVDYIQPRTIIPMHYKTFPILSQSADAFREALAPAYKDRLLAPDVGQSVKWTGEGAEMG